MNMGGGKKKMNKLSNEARVVIEAGYIVFITPVLFIMAFNFFPRDFAYWISMINAVWLIFLAFALDPEAWKESFKS